MKLKTTSAAPHIVLFSLTLLVFSPALPAGFLLLDDTTYVTANTMVWDGFSLAGIRWAFQTLYYGNWSPLTWLYHMFDCTIFGLNPFGHHLSAIILHAINSVLFLVFLRTVNFTLFSSLFAAVLFAVHPLHVEPVVWISSHKDLLAGFFWFLSCILYSRYVAAPSRTRFAALCLCFCFGLMAKSLLISLPIILFLLDFWPLKRLSTKASLKQAVLEKVLLSFIAAIFVVLTIYGQKMIGAVDISLFPLSTRIAHSAYYLLSYLLRCFLPFGLSLQYPYPYTALSHELQFSGILVALVISAFSLIQIKKRPAILFCWGWFLFSLAPFLQIMQVGNQAMADRWMYIPLAGFCLFWGLLFDKLFNQRQIFTKAFLPICLLIFFAAMSFKQSSIWAKPSGIFKHSVRSSERNDRALLYLGLSYAKRDLPLKAVQNYALALEANPDSYEAFEKLGDALSQMNLTERLVPYLEHLYNWQDSSDFVHVQRGKILKYSSRFLPLAKSFKEASGESLLERSLQHFLIAYKTNPRNALLNEAIADNYFQLGEPDKAEVYLTKAEEFGPLNSHILQKVADFHFARGQEAKGCKYVQRSYSVNPNLARVRIQRGRCFFKESKLLEARAEFLIAARLGKAIDAPTTEPFLLLAVLSESEKKFTEAKTWYKQALKIAPVDLETLNALSGLHFRLAEYHDALLALKFIIQGSAEFKRASARQRLAIYKNALRAAEAAEDKEATKEFRILVATSAL